MNDTTRERPEKANESVEELREPYEPPRLTKKRSVARVTLFSGRGAMGAGGLTAT
jgi:hypothetical protein